jgi:hypothetical protein
VKYEAAGIDVAITAGIPDELFGQTGILAVFNAPADDAAASGVHHK